MLNQLVFFLLIPHFRPVSSSPFHSFAFFFPVFLLHSLLSIALYPSLYLLHPHLSRHLSVIFLLRPDPIFREIYAMFHVYAWTSVHLFSYTFLIWYFSRNKTRTIPRKMTNSLNGAFVIGDIFHQNKCWLHTWVFLLKSTFSTKNYIDCYSNCSYGKLLAKITKTNSSLQRKMCSAFIDFFEIRFIE